ncbi:MULTISPECIES: multicopper oxidase family protein [Mycobacterium]|uniref:Multicopper oxidase MmcO n=2 Tax=Mycobacterium TaxID=1763 RepID=A0ABP8F319_9MYCO|nr:MULTISPECIES: multicopper oxidase family protein [Mycobacterium avium complex (MAC)]ETA91798.1 oxidase [Mycobacterium avium 10-5581]ASX03463.1 oxidase [Mycobacterium intracellulare subsp. chimaera]PBA61246.1 oxidase [Mycobacterium intracellulare subsp. chimaera]PBJ62844.1 oxidase [Mycobacterium avium subsp. hominissuis]QWY63715.1 multicopper oxidase family protein [Mycobacterium avium subsp. hominissuis]
MPRPAWNDLQLNRRTFISATMAGGVGVMLAGCGRSTDPASKLEQAIAAAEKARPHTGRTVTATLTPQPATIDLGGPLARSWAYGDALPGPLIRANVGDELAVTVKNRLDRPTSVHWHGIALRNDMDGVFPATPNIAANSDFTYRFTSPHPGTYWAHPHVGLEADYGLYLPVIIDDPAEPANYDAEWIVVLDDWTDGISKSPQQIYDALKSQSMPAEMPGMGAMPGMNPVGSSNLLGRDSGDVDYPYYLVNGRVPTAPTSFAAKPGQRIRIRFINVGADTAFRVALGGHVMTVTHTDGFPVVPTDVDALLLGMAERYDVIVTAGDGVFPLVAVPEGKKAPAGRALLSTGAGTAPEVNFQPPELNRRVGVVDMFAATPAASLGSTKTDVDLALELTGSMTKYDWSINGKSYPNSPAPTIKQGQRATLTFTNSTMMYHPMHLHGHTFQVIKPDGSLGARKDTVNVLPRQKVSAVLVADNPGIWMIHCHNAYHQEAGMMTSLNYTAFTT